MKMWLDDVRPMPDGFDIHVRTEKEAVDLLKTGTVHYMSFDHDLGDERRGTGYGVAKYIESAAFLGEIPKLGWRIHSANPVGAKNITQAMQNADKFWQKRGY